MYQRLVAVINPKLKKPNIQSYSLQLLFFCYPPKPQNSVRDCAKQVKKTNYKLAKNNLNIRNHKERTIEYPCLHQGVKLCDHMLLTYKVLNNQIRLQQRAASTAKCQQDL